MSKIQLAIPVTYTITDYNGKEVQGAFYEQELLIHDLVLDGVLTHLSFTG